MTPIPPHDGGRAAAEPFTLVIFGASGDLTRRKLMPAVFKLHHEGLLPGAFRIVGFARTEMSDDEFRAQMRDALHEFSRVELDAAEWEAFAARLHYHRAADYEAPAAYQSLAERLGELGGQDGAPGNCLFYLALQPMLFGPICERLHAAGLSRKGERHGPWSRVIVEKPFGRDLASAYELTERIQAAFAEEQIFRIDHYLGKETVQNILVLRFANSIFEPIWNSRHVDHVQITMSETVGVEGRGHYYDSSGALRDMVQNHMMHLLCLVAMEPPVSLDPDAVRDEKVQVLRSLRPLTCACACDNVVLGQYTAGRMHGDPVPGYREEGGTASDSTTETFVAIKAFIDNWRWSGVPFYMRTGKRMPSRITEIGIHFKSVPSVLFNAPGMPPVESNVLRLRLQPNEGIAMRFQVKVPGHETRLQPLMMDFDYASSFGEESPEAYERLLLDAAMGDSTLFTRSDEVEAAWAFVEPIMAAVCADREASLCPYPAGTWGPKEADALIESDGRRWELMRRCVAQARVLK